MDITSSIKLSLDKEEAGTGEFKANQDGLVVDVKLNKFPLNYVSSVYDSFKNPYLQKLDGYAQGSINFKKDFSSRVSHKLGKLSFDGNFQISETDVIAGKWQMSFENSRWDISFISPKSEVSFFRRSVLDMKTNTVTQFSEELGFTNLNLTAVAPTIKSLSSISSEQSLAYYTSAIAFKKCVFQDVVYEGSFKYGYAPDQKYFQGDLKSEKNSFHISYSSKETQKALDIKASQFPWNSSFNFLSPFLMAKEGILDGKLEGRWTDTWEGGQWLMKSTTTDMQEFTGKLSEFLTKTMSFFDLATLAHTKSNFDLISKNGIVTLNNIGYELPENFKVSGSLSTKQKSFLTLSKPKDKKFKSIKKEIIEPYWLQKDEE